LLRSILALGHLADPSRRNQQLSSGQRTGRELGNRLDATQAQLTMAQESEDRAHAQALRHAGRGGRATAGCWCSARARPVGAA